MHFLTEKLKKKKELAKKKVKEIVTAPKDQINPRFQKLFGYTGDFLSFGREDAKQFLKAALAKVPWKKIFEDVEG